MARTARRRFQLGAAAIEMALLLIPLILFTMTAVELGRALYTYNTLLKGTRDGARWLSMQSAGIGHDAARCLVVYGTTNCPVGEAALVPGLTTDMVRIVEQASVPSCITSEACYGTIDLVTVSVSGYDFQTLMPTLLPDTLTHFTLGTVATTMRQPVS